MFGQSDVNSCPVGAVMRKTGKTGIMKGFICNIYTEASCPGAALVFLFLAVFGFRKRADACRYLADITKLNFPDTAFACKKIAAIVLQVVGIRGRKSYAGNNDSLVFCELWHNFEKYFALGIV
jgi:hypothetical protein